MFCFWCLVADSFLSPTSSAPYLDKLIRNNPRHFYIWLHGSLILAPLPNYHKNPKAVSFSCFPKLLFNQFGSLPCSAQKTSFMWVINFSIASQCVCSNISLDIQTKFWWGFILFLWDSLNKVLTSIKVFLNALTLLICTIILSGSSN